MENLLPIDLANVYGDLLEADHGAIVGSTRAATAQVDLLALLTKVVVAQVILGVLEGEAELLGPFVGRSGQILRHVFVDGDFDFPTVENPVGQISNLAELLQVTIIKLATQSVLESAQLRVVKRQIDRIGHALRGLRQRFEVVQHLGRRPAVLLDEKIEDCHQAGEDDEEKEYRSHVSYLSRFADQSPWARKSSSASSRTAPRPPLARVM